MKGEQMRKVLFRKLKKLFYTEIVKTKWPATKDSQDAFKQGIIYSPETDIAIGPFNIDGEISANNKRINQAKELWDNALIKMNQISEKPYNPDHLNPNPRCFIAIEVGGSGSRKHLLGDIFNAATLGKIGIAVGTNNKQTEAYKRIYRYIDFAKSVGKTKENFENLMIINGEKLLANLHKKIRQPKRGRGGARKLGE